MAVAGGWVVCSDHMQRGVACFIQELWCLKGRHSFALAVVCKRWPGLSRMQTGTLEVSRINHFCVAAFLSTSVG